MSPQKQDVGQSQQLMDAAEQLINQKQMYMQYVQKIKDNEKNDDYQEFLEYLHKQQEDQAKDSMFAHSKKQREMLKAKEFSKKDSLANVQECRN